MDAWLAELRRLDASVGGLSRYLVSQSECTTYHLDPKGIEPDPLRPGSVRWKREIRAATPEQLAAFDAILQRAAEAEPPPWHAVRFQFLGWVDPGVHDGWGLQRLDGMFGNDIQLHACPEASLEWHERELDVTPSAIARDRALSLLRSYEQLRREQVVRILDRLVDLAKAGTTMPSEPDAVAVAIIDRQLVVLRARDAPAVAAAAARVVQVWADALPRIRALAPGLSDEERRRLSEGLRSGDGGSR